MDPAASNVRRSASAEPMSGRGAPARTTTPMPERARSVRLSAATVPCATSWPSASPTMMSTSTGSFRASRAGTASAVCPMDGPQPVTSLWPVARSNSGASAR